MNDNLPIFATVDLALAADVDLLFRHRKTKGLQSEGPPKAEWSAGAVESRAADLWQDDVERFTPAWEARLRREAEGVSQAEIDHVEAMIRGTGDSTARRRQATRYMGYFLTKRHCVALAFSNPDYFASCLAPLKAARRAKDELWRRLSAMSVHDRLVVRRDTPNFWVGGPSAEQDPGFVAAAFREIVRVEERYRARVLARYVRETEPKIEIDVETVVDEEDEIALAELVGDIVQ